MKVEKGINPNCSELVIRLDEWGSDELREELKTIGIREALVEGFWHNISDDSDWDEERNVNSDYIYIDSLIPEIREKIRAYYEDFTDDQEKKEKELKKLGYNMEDSSCLIVDNGKIPDCVNKAYLSIRDKFENNQPAIVAHQHCQSVIFPYLKRIADLFDREVEGYDGGSDTEYYAWVEAGCPNIETWDWSENE